MIGFLLLCLVVVVGVYVAKLVIDMLGLPAQVQTIALLIVGLIALYVLISRFPGI